jgi:type II secretory pathway pseudopilin PulG
MVDLIAVITVIGIVAAIAVPSMTNAIDATRLAQSSREVERELQIAKSRAVGKGRPVRIRFNCPSAGMYRITELIGTPTVPDAADSAANRCNEAVYPFPAADNDPLTVPNLDGPARRISSAVAFDQIQTIEFWPNGTAHYDTGVNPWPMIPVGGISVSLKRGNATTTITVNGLGKILLQSQ